MLPIDDPDVRSTLSEARQAYVAVASKRGPHVTPQLYGLADGRLWFFAAATTLKAKVLRREPRVGVVVRADERAVVIGGRVDALDPADVGSIVERFPHWRSTTGGVASFALRNAVDLAGFVTDTLRRRTGKIPPPRRVLFSVAPERLAVIDRGVVALSDGEWPGRANDRHGATGDAVVAWTTPRGPLALPATWDGDAMTATIAPALASLADLPSTSAMSVVFDEYGRPGPAGKRGLLLRGDGRIEKASDGGAAIRFSPDHGVRWHGVRTERVEA